MSVTLHDTAVVIPARNEAARIVACLEAIARQAADRTVVHLVVNNTQDATASIARAFCRDTGLAAQVTDVTLPADQGVGLARRMGAEGALYSMPGLRYLLATDADSIVGPDWIDRNIAHLSQVDAVCGNVGPIEEEKGNLDGMDHELAGLEGRYRDLVMKFYHVFAPDPHSTYPNHGEASGATLGFRADVYASVGGFAAIRSSEDRDIVRRLKRAGYAVRHADDVTVRTSLRLSGRAPGGMSDALKARVLSQGYTIDECLPPPDWLWSQRHALPVWPHDGAGYVPLRVNELDTHIARLETLIASATARPGHRNQHNGTATPLADPLGAPLPVPAGARRAKNRLSQLT